MTFPRSTITLWLYLGVMIPLFVADCPYKECNCVEADIYCDGIEIKTLQLINNSTGYQSLSLKENGLTMIPAQSLPPNLTSIFIENNPITSIDSSAFDLCGSTLNTLTILNASLKGIPDSFKCLHSLMELTLKGIPITDWNVDAMKNLGPTLTSLYLENVDLTKSPSWLQYFTKLTDLSILEGTLSFLPDGSLDMVANSLISLTLTNMSLTEVPKALTNLSKLKALYLSNNKISSTKWLPGSSSLQTLSLNGNNIFNATELSISLRPYAISLTGLAIEDNALTAIPDLSFLTQIEELSLRDNKLSDINAGSMPADLVDLDLKFNYLTRIPKIMASLVSVTYMALQNNRIAWVEGSDFTPSPKYVDLAFNLITELTDNSFPNNPKIEELYLYNNPLSKISMLAFKPLTGLKVLDLQHTKLTRLPLALMNLPSLKSVEFTYSSSLICTCVEKSLGQLVMFLGPQSVLGQCGQLTIYNFFAMLSPGCP